jgi:ABC-2 type transport system permease protein
MAVMRGVIDLKDFIFFASMIVAFLYANAVIVELKKAD